MKKVKYFWLFLILLIFVIVSGYGMARYYQGVKYNEPVFETESEEDLHLGI